MDRYQRQESYSAFGTIGQARLANSFVLICGCGALGSSVASILVRAGVGQVALVDPDTVALDNLHRQFLFTEEDAERKRFKTEAARQTLLAANSRVQLDTIQEYFTPETEDSILSRLEVARSIDLIIDGTDNFSSRFVLNSLAVRRRIPFISAGVLGATGQGMVVLPGETPCLACLWDENLACSEEYNRLQRQEFDTKGILSPVVQIMASWQAMEAMKCLSGNIQAVARKMFAVDLWNNSIRYIDYSQSGPGSECPLCASLKKQH